MIRTARPGRRRKARSWLSRCCFTPRPIWRTFPRAGELDQIRRQGWALNEGELFGGIRGVGAPVFSPKGRAVAAVAVAVPRSRSQDEVLDLAQAVLTAARDLRPALSRGLAA